MVCLLTNNHIINDETLELCPKITLIINDTIKKQIDLSKRRFKFTNKKMDYTAIEIIEADDINDYLEIDDFIVGKDYQNGNIYCIEYPLGQIAKLSEGKVIKRFNWNIVHNLGTRQGSSGSPLVMKGSHKVIGMHIGKMDNYNLGVFIYDVIEDILNNNKNIEKEGKISKYYYKIIKFLTKNKYCLVVLCFIILLTVFLSIFLYKYVFEKHKHKILYYENNKIKYNGTMIDDKYDGKGVLYYENGNIWYNGTWIQNKKDGYGRLYSENGQIKYDGEWIKDRKEGKGISYYDNGNIEYNGTWTQDKKKIFTDYIIIKVEILVILVNGIKINLMEKVLDIMKMVKLLIMDHFLKIRKMDMDYFIMKMGILVIMEPGIKMLIMEWVYYIMKLEIFFILGDGIIL